jgi:hypothetical protein
MSQFSVKDLEALKRVGTTIQDIHYNVSNTILSADSCAADVRTLNKNTGQFEIVLTGTISKLWLEDMQKPPMGHK